MTGLCGMPSVKANWLECTAGYDVGGFRLVVHVQPEAGPVEGILAPIERLLGRFRTAASEGADTEESSAEEASAWTLCIGRGLGRAAVAEDGLHRVWEGPSPAGFHVVNSVAIGRRRCELAGIGRLDVDLRHKTASIDLLPETEPNSVHYFLTTILCDGLTDAGHCVVHAACLEKTIRGGTGVLLVVAPSGTGKSTTALALTGAGWRLMGDDITVLTRTPAGVRAWGFPRFCNVRRPTLGLLPWLAELPLVPTSVAGTFALPLEHLGDRVSTGVPAPAEPAAIVCLERPNGEGHRLLPLDRAAALMHVAEENVQPIEGAGDDVARRSFGMLAELVRTTPAFSLSAGPELDSLGAAIRRQLCL